MGRIVMVLPARTFFMAFLIFLMATGSSQGGRRWTAQKPLAGGSHSASPEGDDNKVEQAWIECQKKLTAKEVVVYNQALTDLKLALSTKSNVEQAARILPQLKRSYLDCLDNLHLLSLDSSTEAHSNSLSADFEQLFSLMNPPRRYLTTKRHTSVPLRDRPHPIKPHHLNAPSTSSAFGKVSRMALPITVSAPPDSGPILAPEPVRSPSPYRQPPVSPPTLSPRPSPSAQVHKHRPPTSQPETNHVSDNDNDHQMDIIIAASITAAATILIVSLLYVCIFRGRNRKVGPGDGQKDERPLLNLGFSNLSAGSSGKSQSIGSSSINHVHANTGKTPSLLSTLSSKFNRHASTVTEPSTSEAMSSVGLGPLKPPSGRVIPPPSRPAQPPPPPPAAPSPAPPPPPKARPPPLPPKSMPGKNYKRNNNSRDGDSQDDGAGAPKAKLKPFFWDKVLADPDHSMVWHELKAGSFQFNEEMMESLFGYAATDKNKKGPKKESSSIEPVQYIQIIDSKKAQNLSILLRALNLTAEEVTDALHEGNELPIELVQTLLKMAPTTEEELKLRLFTGDITQLGPAERFLKVLVEIPFAFKRLETILFMTSFDEEISGVKESFATLEVASSKLRHSRLFLKLLEAVLKTGNRMNDGTYRGGAQAFKLDTLLKLSDVKGTDGKITLLHFVVQEIIRSEGIRAARSDKASHSDYSVKTKDLVEGNTHETAVYYRNLGLQVVSGLSTELEDVKKAAIIDADSVTSTLSKLGSFLKKAKDFLNSELKNLEEESEFCHTLTIFLENAEDEINHLVEEEKRIMTLVKSTADYFHGNAGKNEGLRLFAIVRDFLRMLDKACKEVRNTPWEPAKTHKKETQAMPSSPESRQQSPDIRQRLFPAIVDRRVYESSSDDENLSP